MGIILIVISIVWIVVLKGLLDPFIDHYYVHGESYRVLWYTDRYGKRQSVKLRL